MAKGMKVLHRQPQRLEARHSPNARPYKETAVVALLEESPE